MATVQTTSDSAQTRPIRAATLSHSRPWRSSPLAFSTLPPIFSGSSEDSHDKDVSPPESLHEFGQVHRSPSACSSSVSDQHGSPSPSAYGSRNASGVTFIGSSSSTSLPASSTVHGPSSSQGHGNSQTHSHRLSKSRGSRCTSPTQQLDRRSSVTSDVSILPPPRARTISHGHSRSATFPASSVSLPSTIPQTYSQTSPRPTPPESDTNGTSNQPSVSRDPATNWMSSTPFGPAMTPKFSRLAMASPAVVMPLSAREYRKRKARKSQDKGKEKEPSLNHGNVSDPSRPPGQGVPKLKVSPPPSEDVHQPTTSPGDNSMQPPPADPSPKPHLLPQSSVSFPPSTKSKRPHTPPRSSPLATHPPISPKSSSGTFYSFVSASEDETQLPNSQGSNLATTDAPVRRVPRPRRRKSVPERLSNGARLSLLEAMNRLSIASQASGHTLFYDVELEGNGQVVNGNGPTDGDRNESGEDAQHTPIQRTQSLEDLSSTLARTGIEVVRPTQGDAGPVVDEAGIKAKRNVRMVRISDTVEVSPAPVPRPRKLTKSRRVSVTGPGSVRGLAPGADTGTEIMKEGKTPAPTQAHERRSLLPWKSKTSESNSKVASAGEKGKGNEVDVSSNGVIDLKRTITNRPSRAETDGRLGAPTIRSSSDVNVSSSKSAPPRKPRRYTFSFFSSAALHPQRSKHAKAHTAPATLDLGLEQKDKNQPEEPVQSTCASSGTDSTSTSIHTLKQGSQTTLTPVTPTASISKGSSAVPMLKRVNTQAMAMGMEGTPTPSQQSDCEGKQTTGTKSGSTSSLITDGSSGSAQPALRLTVPDAIGEPFVYRPSGLKASITEASEEEREGVQDSVGGKPSMNMPDDKMLMHPHLSMNAGSSSRLSLNQNKNSNPSLRSASRPGTSSSTLTSATDASGSYVSFSTLPASTVTSTTSTSRSVSPSSMGGDKDKRELAQDSPPPMVSPQSRGKMHPMFTVPLLTIPALAVPSHRSTFVEGVGSGAGVGTGIPRYMSGRKTERHGSVAVVSATVSPLPTWSDDRRHHVHTPVPTHVNGTYALPNLPASKTTKSRRPQTAPAGGGDMAFKLYEDAKAMGIDPFEGRGNSVRLSKRKSGGESKFKMVLKGLFGRAG